jgi:hypothetical protein
VVAENILDSNNWIEVAHPYEYHNALSHANFWLYSEKDSGLAWRFVQNAASHTEMILRDHWDAVTRIAAALLKRRTLTGDEVYALIGQSDA